MTSMKFNLIVTFFLLLLFSCSEKHEGFYIKGKIDGLDEGMAVLQKRESNKFISIDSSGIKNGKFILQGKIDEPQMCYITINDSLTPIRIMLENVTYSLKANINNLNVPNISGSKLQDKVNEYDMLVKPYEDRMDSIYSYSRHIGKNGDPHLLDSLNRMFKALEIRENEVSKQFVKNNSDNVIGPYILWGTLSYDLSLSDMMELSSKFNPSLDSTIYVKQIKEYIETLIRVKNGEIFTNINLPDTSGNMTSLASTRGKFTLIDFWASWCKPCRVDDPKFTEIYKQFNPKGFQIYGVSLDNDPITWKKAINEDGLKWIQVSDLKGWQSAAVKLYGVRAIPHTILINPLGQIIEKDLSPNDLKTVLKEYLEN